MWRKGRGSVSAAEEEEEEEEGREGKGRVSIRPASSGWLR